MTKKPRIVWEKMMAGKFLWLFLREEGLNPDRMDPALDDEDLDFALATGLLPGPIADQPDHPWNRAVLALAEAGVSSADEVVEMQCVVRVPDGRTPSVQDRHKHSWRIAGVRRIGGKVVDFASAGKEKKERAVEPIGADWFDEMLKK